MLDEKSRILAQSKEYIDTAGAVAAVGQSSAAVTDMSRRKKAKESKRSSTSFNIGNHIYNTKNCTRHIPKTAIATSLRGAESIPREKNSSAFESIKSTQF